MIKAMHKTIIRRILILIPQLLVISVIIFLMAIAMPGDALTGFTENPNLSFEQIEAQREALGLNDPWHVQYARWISGIVLRADFGDSVIHARPVVNVIGERLYNTFWLALLTFTLTYLLAVPFGIISGRYSGKFVDRIISTYTYFALAMPLVVLALIILLVFSFNLGLFPFRGSVSIEALDGNVFRYLLSRLHHMVLPAFTGAILGTVGIIQYLRNEIADYKSADFVTTARSKGVPERIIYSRHIFKNALVPMVSNIGFVLVALFAGAVLTETVFSYPGMGLLFLESIRLRDFTVVNAIVIIIAALTALGGLLSDILLTIVDPRIRIR